MISCRYDRKDKDMVKKRIGRALRPDEKKFRDSLSEKERKEFDKLDYSERADYMKDAQKVKDTEDIYDDIKERSADINQKYGNPTFTDENGQEWNIVPPPDMADVMKENAVRNEKALQEMRTSFRDELDRRINHGRKAAQKDKVRIAGHGGDFQLVKDFRYAESEGDKNDMLMFFNKTIPTGNMSKTKELGSWFNRKEPQLLSIHDSINTKNDLVKQHRTNVKNGMAHEYLGMMKRQMIYRGIDKDTIMQNAMVMGMLFAFYKPFREEVKGSMEEIKEKKMNRKALKVDKKMEKLLDKNGGDVLDPKYQDYAEKKNKFIRKRDGRDMWLPETAAMQSISFDKECHDNLVAAGGNKQEIKRIMEAYERANGKLKEEMAADGIEDSEFDAMKVKMVGLMTQPQADGQRRTDVAELYKETMAGDYVLNDDGAMMDLGRTDGDISKMHITKLTAVLDPDESTKMMTDILNDKVAESVRQKMIQPTLTTKEASDACQFTIDRNNRDINQFIKQGLASNMVNASTMGDAAKMKAVELIIEEAQKVAEENQNASVSTYNGPQYPF